MFWDFILVSKSKLNADLAEHNLRLLEWRKLYEEEREGRMRADAFVMSLEKENDRLVQTMGDHAAFYKSQLGSLLDHIAPKPLTVPPSSPAEIRYPTSAEIMAEPAYSKREQAVRQQRYRAAVEREMGEKDAEEQRKRRAVQTDEEYLATRPYGAYDGTLGIYTEPEDKDAKQ